MGRFYIPKEFQERYKKIFEDWEEFVSTIKIPLPVSIRINSIKNGEDAIELLSKFKLEKFKWYNKGYRLRNPKGIGKSIPYFLGKIMVQEEVSMIPPILMEIEPKMKILDMAAAPGSKTTQISDLMENTGLLVANEVSISRTRGLYSNIERAGVLNTTIIIADGRLYGKYKPEYFDRVLLDAPCSSEGTVRKNRSIFYRWKTGIIKRMSHLQKAMIASAYRTLKKNGIMVYSTCTFSPEENEEVVDHLIKKEKNVEIMKININLKTRGGITKWNGKQFSKEVKKCIRIAPQDNNTGGFFIAKIRKN